MERAHDFSVMLEAGTIKEAALLVRLGANGVKQRLPSATHAQEDGAVYHWLTIGKRKDALNALPHRRD
jgi:hypothetical protein